MSLLRWISENPLKAAAIGTAAYFTGGADLGDLGTGAAGAGAGSAAGAAGGGLLAAEGAASDGGLLAANPIAAYTATGGAEGSIMANGLTGAGGSSGAVGSGTYANTLGNAKNFASAVKPYGDAAGAAMQVKGLLSSPQQPYQQAQSSAPPGMMPQGTQTLAQLYQQGAQISPEEQARMQRKTMWG